MKRPVPPSRRDRQFGAAATAAASAIVPPASGSKPEPAVPDTVPLSSDATAATAAPAGDPIAAGDAVARAIVPTPPHPTVDTMMAPGEKIATALEPLVKVDGTVPLPFDQLTPLLPAGEAFDPEAAYTLDVRDGSLHGMSRFTEHRLALDANQQFVGDIAFELGLDADTPAEIIVEQVRSLVRRLAEFDELLPLDRLGEDAARADAMHGMPEAPSAERRGFEVTFHVDHDGESLAPGDIAWVTSDQHERLLRGTAIADPWEQGISDADHAPPGFEDEWRSSAKFRMMVRDQRKRELKA